jgi:hypothetical protein
MAQPQDRQGRVGRLAILLPGFDERPGPAPIRLARNWPEPPAARPRIA